MIEIGTIQHLTVQRLTAPGAFLSDQDGNEILLPNRYLTADIIPDSVVEVFVYKDSEDRPIATTETPLAMKDEFACLKVVDVNNMGAFLDLGLQKDLLVPYKQQAHRMYKGEWHMIFLYLDEKTQRLVATSKLHPHFNKDLTQLEENQKVTLLIGQENDLGYQVVADNQYNGMIFHNEIHQDLMMGDKTTGYIKSIRPDGKLDVMLQPAGVEHMESGAVKILEVLEEEGGYLEITDKSDPEDIKFHFQLSKKAFKRSLGNLYKQRKVILEKKGIRLVSENK